MIPPEQCAEIRRLYYAEHWRVGTIATTLGVHHDTVRRALERFMRPGTQVRPSTRDPYKPFLLFTLERHPRLRATDTRDQVVDFVRDFSARGKFRLVPALRPGQRTQRAGAPGSL